MPLMPDVEEIMTVVRRLVSDALASGEVKDPHADIERVIKAGLELAWPDMERSPYRVQFLEATVGGQTANLHFAVDHHSGTGVRVHLVSFEIPWHPGQGSEGGT